jgi:RNA polymerase sigma-70 factor (ECF subfamily)
MDTYRGEAPLFTWLCTFCRYEISKQRKARHRAQGDVPLVEEDPSVKAALDSLLAHTSEDPDISVHRSEIRRLIMVAMDHLPSLYADTLEFKYLRDMPVTEIATQIGKSPKATESILTRARAAFRDSFTTLVAEHSNRRGESQSLSSIIEY